MTNQKINTQDLYDKFKRDILGWLRQEASRNRHNEFQISEIHRFLELPNIPEPDKSRLQIIGFQILHELYFERIIIPGTANVHDISNTMKWPFFILTDYGRQVLQISEYSPYDPDGYLRRLKSEIANIDETIIRYVEESIKCLRMNCLLAAAVTIGCASEQALLLLIDQFRQAIIDPVKKNKFENDTKDWIIARKYKAFRRYLDSAAGNLPDTLRTPLDQQFHGTFDLIRQIRNEAGHPTGGTVTLDLIRPSLINFPGYCKYVYSLMDHFAHNGVNL
ncbi:MAG: hypothetical protein ABSA77_12340 [Thermoguttaceae bacterium]|jgi:hypothetical protein